jgi:hypothetical protein
MLLRQRTSRLISLRQIRLLTNPQHRRIRRLQLTPWLSIRLKVVTPRLLRLTHRQTLVRRRTPRRLIR